MIDKLVFLYSFNGGDLPYPFEPVPVEPSPGLEFVLSDPYVDILRLLARAGIANQIFVIVKTREDSFRFAGFGVHMDSRKVQIVFPPNMAAAWAFVGPLEPDDVVWTRGTSPFWSTELDKFPHVRKGLYNTARVLADPSIYDLVFAEDDTPHKEIRNHPFRFPFVKSCNEEVFFPNGSDKEYDFITAGTVSERKGQLRVIKAASKIRGVRSLAFPGTVREEEYKEECLSQARKAGLSIEFPGHVTRHELSAFFNRSRVNVLASWREQAPRVLLEAACCDVPSVVTDKVGGAKSHVTPKTGVVCKERHLSRAMRKALESKDLSPREGYLKEFSSQRALKLVMAAFRAKGWT